MPASRALTIPFNLNFMADSSLGQVYKTKVFVSKAILKSRAKTHCFRVEELMRLFLNSLFKK